VTLPHSWNKFDAQEGIQYFRGTGKYRKSFSALNSWKGKRIFIRFEGVNITAKVVLNGQDVGEHKGGYAAFSFEITDQLLFDQENLIEVAVSNEANLEVIPLVGDFNNYGGIYRPVNLIVTEPVCITPLDYTSPGSILTNSNLVIGKILMQLIKEDTHISRFLIIPAKVPVPCNGIGYAMQIRMILGI